MQYCYVRGKQIGEGTYARIYIAEQFEATTQYPKIVKSSEDPSTRKLVALKRIKKNSQMQGIDLSTIREIKALKICKSNFIVELIEVFRFDHELYIAMEYLPITLETILKDKSLILLPSDIKTWMAMLVKGLKTIHDLFMVHRDLKPSNILLKDGVLKIADFGLCRSLDSGAMTTQAFTRWYRPPELLLGCGYYGTSADMWSLGCVMAEMLLRTPLFAGSCDISQLDLIFQALGTPNNEYFEKITDKMPITFKQYESKNVEQLFGAAGEHAQNLLLSLLDLDPNKRPTCDKVMSHLYFKTPPYANSPENLNVFAKNSIVEKEKNVFK